MLTQSAPAIVNALNGSLPDDTVRALTQSLGNCNQPLTHRGDINFQPSSPRQDGPGTYSGGQWNPQDYSGLFPDTSRGAGADVPGWGGPGGINSSNFYGDQFFFPTSQEFTLNNFYGGPNVYNGGNAYFQNTYADNSTTQNLTVTNLTVNTINGEPVDGAAGPPGQQGPQGQQGAAGGGVVVNNQIPLPPPQQDWFLDDAVLEFEPVEVVTNVWFDPDTCELTAQKRRLRVPLRLKLRGHPLRFYGPVRGQ